MRLFTRVDDRPGGLARLLARVADAGGNLVTVNHLREAVPLHVRETGVDLVLETRGEEHAARSSRRSRPPATRSSASTAAAARRRARDRRRQGARGRRARRAAAPPALRGAAARRDRGAGARAPRDRRPGHGDRLPAQGARGDARAVRAARPRRLHRSCRTCPRGWSATARTSRRSSRACSAAGVRELFVPPGTRPSRASSTAPPSCSTRWARCASVRRDRHHRLPREPPPDLRRGDDPGDVREGADGHVHHQPDLLRRRRDRRLDRGGPPPRDRAAGLDRPARHGRLREARADLDEDRPRGVGPLPAAATATGCRAC